MYIAAAKKKHQTTKSTKTSSNFVLLLNFKIMSSVKLKRKTNKCLKTNFSFAEQY
jgi:hypothetical protein